MGDTMIEKILARASGQDRVRPGDIAVCRPDMVVQLDLLFTIEGSWHRPKKLFDPDRVTDFEHGDETCPDVVVGEDDAALTSRCAASPGAGETVGLLFSGHRGKIAVEDARTLLYDVAVFVSQHNADRAGTKPGGEVEQQP